MFVLAIIPVIMAVVGLVLIGFGVAKRSEAKRNEQDTSAWTWCTGLGCSCMVPALILLGYALYFIYLVANKSGPLI